MSASLPAPELRDYMDDFARLSAMAQMIRNAFSKKEFIYGDITGKTEKLIRERAVSFGLEKTLPTVEINEDTIKAITHSGKSDKGKIINLVIGIRKKLSEDAKDAPYLREIGERAEAVVEAFEERQISTETALKRLETLVGDYLTAKSERLSSGLDEDTFGFYWKLKTEGMELPSQNATIIKNLFDRFPNFKHNPEELRQLKAGLYKFLFPILGKEKMIAMAEKLLG